MKCITPSCEEIATAALGSAQKRSSGELAWLCPIHDDHDPSLMINPKKDCFFCGPCGKGGNAWQFAAWLARVSPDDKPAVTAWLKEHGLLGNGNEPRKIVAEYIYHDPDGCPVMLVRRYQPKTFRQFRFEAGQWVPGLKDQDGRLVVDLVPYHLPELLSAEVVFVVEGEKDADRLAELGLTATCNPMGAGKWHEEYSRWFEGKKVVVLADNDQAGRAHARAVARSLLPIAHAVKVVELPGLPEKGDVSDWLQQGHTLDELKAAVKSTPALSAEDRTDVCIEPEEAPVTLERTWPRPLAPEAFHGIAGELVRLIEPHTEADPAALLLQFLVCFGNIIGPKAYYAVEADRHGGNLFLTLVGDTAKARKGTSLGRVLRVFRMIDPTWTDTRRGGGLSSGEGLIEQVRDAPEIEDPKNTDQGVDDKRLLIVEPEFAHVLKAIERQGNTLSDVLRRAWDGDVLQAMTRKHNRLKATGAHISIIAHITKDELLRLLTETEAANGLGNRFLWGCVRRSKALPEGGNLKDQDLEPIAERLRAAIAFGSRAERICRDDNARAMWAHVYTELSAGKPGLLGAMIARSEAQVVRLSLLYALLDQSMVIRREHLLAALAVWGFCEESARYVFGDSLGDPTADTILSALRAAGAEGMTRTEIRDFFGRNKGAAEIQRALSTLASQGLAERRMLPTDGRPEERWFVITTLTTKTTKG